MHSPPDPWSVRAARTSDKNHLASFSCADAAIPWELEVQNYIQRDLLLWASEPRAAVNDPRALLIFHKPSRALVGVAAHERAEIAIPGVAPLVATRLEVVAVARSWQGKRLGGASGPRVSDVVMSAVMRDIETRPQPRSNKIFAAVHQNNARSLGLCRRYALVHEMSRQHPEYIRLIT